jgi:phenylpyruvate tautomerase PptA (4-oxalocrotonate tautomerase family)
VTDVFVSLLRENMRNYVWVIVQEIKDGCFGADGQVCGLKDIRAIQAGSAEKAEEY